MEQESQELFHLQLTVNGDSISTWVEPGETLLYVLRERLQLFGTKAGCERGECGACTVLLNQEPVYACLILAIQAQNTEITTIEGLQGVNGEVHPVQRAFIEQSAIQCGFCTPGLILTVAALFQKNPSPTSPDIQAALEGHLCRCGAYAKILKAIQSLQPERDEHAA